MNSLDELIHQSNLLIKIIDELITSIRKAKDKNNLNRNS